MILAAIAIVSALTGVVDAHSDGAPDSATMTGRQPSKFAVSKFVMFDVNLEVL